MSTVQLPRVDDEIRLHLNRIKERRKDRNLTQTLEYLITLDSLDDLTQIWLNTNISRVELHRALIQQKDEKRHMDIAILAMHRMRVHVGRPEKHVYTHAERRYLEGWSDGKISKKGGIPRSTVTAWRNRNGLPANHPARNR